MPNDKSIMTDVERRANALLKIIERALEEGTGINEVIVIGWKNFQKFKTLRDEFETQVQEMADFQAGGAAQSAASKMLQAMGTARRMGKILEGIKFLIEHDIIGKEERRLQKYERLIASLVGVVDKELVLELRTDQDQDVKKAYEEVKGCENDLAAVTRDLEVLKNDVPELLEFLNLIIGNVEMVWGAATPEAVKKHSKGIDQAHLKNLEKRFEACEGVAFKEDKDLIERMVDFKKRAKALLALAEGIRKKFARRGALAA